MRRCSRKIVRRDAFFFGGLSLLFCIAFYCFRDRRPVCEDGEFGPDCRIRQSVEHLPEDHPSMAFVKLDEHVTELRWVNGRLYHPIGGFFGGTHSALIATFQSGAQIKIEKLGMGSVTFCPSVTKRACNLRSGRLHKFVRGEFIKPTTWQQLHALMVHDFYHYDVVDNNCHHAVQRTWNAVVIEGAQDSSPAPDNVVLARWEGFLRWWSGTDMVEAVAGEEDLQEEVAEARILYAFPLNGATDSPAYDHPVLRRRRRRAVRADRCRASKLKDWDNTRDPQCPVRDSSLFEGPLCNCDWESSKSIQCHLWGPSTQRKDKDSSLACPSDWKFTRFHACGGEKDISGSSHCRLKFSASSTSEGCSSDESNELQPMDPRRDLFWGASAPGGDSEDSCVRSGSEFSHTKGRSKNNQDSMCGPETDIEMGAAKGERRNGTFVALGENQLCQWKCKAGYEPRFYEYSTSEWVCEDAVRPLKMEPRDRISDCQKQCALSCNADCMKQCDYLTSKSMNSGGAQCVVLNAEDIDIFAFRPQMFDPHAGAGGVSLVIFVSTFSTGLLGLWVYKKGYRIIVRWYRHFAWLDEDDDIETRPVRRRRGAPKVTGIQKAAERNRVPSEPPTIVASSDPDPDPNPSAPGPIAPVRFLSADELKRLDSMGEKTVKFRKPFDDQIHKRTEESLHAIEVAVGSDRSSDELSATSSPAKEVKKPQVKVVPDQTSRSSVGASMTSLASHDVGTGRSQTRSQSAMLKLNNNQDVPAQKYKTMHTAKSEKLLNPSFKKPSKSSVVESTTSVDSSALESTRKEKGHRSEKKGSVASVLSHNGSSNDQVEKTKRKHKTSRRTSDERTSNRKMGSIASASSQQVTTQASLVGHESSSSDNSSSN